MRTKRGLPIPDDLAAALTADPAILAQWDRLRPSCQQRYIEHIGDAKRPETRVRRVQAALRGIADWYARNYGTAKPAADRSSR
jgi:uncharacterized protein YdeI (YjbR/CyaY-like superfamily)